MNQAIMRAVPPKPCENKITGRRRSSAKAASGAAEPTLNSGLAGGPMSSEASFASGAAGYQTVTRTVPRCSASRGAAVGLAARRWRSPTWPAMAGPRSVAATRPAIRNKARTPTAFSSGNHRARRTDPEAASRASESLIMKNSDRRESPLTDSTTDRSIPFMTAPATRARILDQGLDLVSRGGLASVTLGGLAERVGMSKSGLFAHFRSKEAVQIALLDQSAALADEVVVKPALAGPPGLARLRALVGLWLGWPARAGLSGGCPIAAALFELDDL